ncbi:MAG: catalase-related domain-containing protein [Terriglobales bacterium]
MNLLRAIVKAACRYFTQPQPSDQGRRVRTSVQKPDAQKRLIANIVGSLKSVPKYIQEKQIGHFLKADPAYGRGVAEGLGINVEHLVPQEPALASD